MQAESTGSLKALEWLAWLENNVRQVALGAGVVALIAGGVFYYNYRQGVREAAAADALILARAKAGRSGPTAAELRQVQTTFAGTAAARQAGMLAAGALFSEGKYDEARAEFAKFADGKSDDPLTAQAALGVATCLEAQKNADAALAAYQGVVTKHPNEPVAIQAKLAVGRLHEAKGQHAEALKIYQEVTRAPGMTAWQADFASRRDELLRRFPQLAPTNVPTATPVNIPGTAPAPAAK